MNGLDLLVEVVLLLGLFHLALDAVLDRAVDVEFFQLDVEHLGHAGEPVDGIEDFEKVLLLGDRELKVRPDGVRQLARVVDTDRGDHRFVVEILTLLDIVLERRRDTAVERLCLFRRDRARGIHLYGGAVEAFLLRDGMQARSLDTLDQDLDIAVRQFEALDDRDDRADLVDLVRCGVVHRRVVLRREKNFLFRVERFLQSQDARFPPHHEGGHHVGKDDDVPDGHHRKLPYAGFLFGLHVNEP